MTKQITVSENCYAELLRQQRGTKNDYNGKALSMSNVIGSAWSEIKLLKDEQVTLREEILKLKDEKQKALQEWDIAVSVASKPRPFIQRVKAVFFP